MFNACLAAAVELQVVGGHEFAIAHAFAVTNFGNLALALDKNLIEEALKVASRVEDSLRSCCTLNASCGVDAPLQNREMQSLAG